MDDINLLGMLRRWWLWLLCGAVIGGGAGALAASAATPTYSADVELLVGPISADFDDTLRASGQLARTYAELATSRRVLDKAIEETGAQVTPTELQESDAVRAQSNDITRIVSIEVQNPDARTAARLANEIARRIIELAALTPPQETSASQRLLEQDEISRLSGADQDAVAEAVRRVLGTTSLAGQVEIVQAAEPPLEPVSPGTALITPLAALLGMLAVAIAILLRESFLRGVSDEQSLGSLESPPFLGALDVPVSWRQVPPLAVEVKAKSLVDAYRTIAAKVGFLDNEPRVRTLLVVDAGASRQSGTVAANLAAVLAETQRRVMLVDANELADGATSALGLGGRPGYEELTAREEESTLKPLGLRQLPTLSVIPREAAPESGGLDEEHVERLVQRFRGKADIVIVSGAPVNLSPRALFWGRVADGTLLVVRAGRTREEQVREAVRSLGFVGAHVVGTVLARDRRLRGRSAFDSHTPSASDTVVTEPKRSPNEATRAEGVDSRPASAQAPRLKSSR